MGLPGLVPKLNMRLLKKAVSALIKVSSSNNLMNVLYGNNGESNNAFRTSLIASLTRLSTNVTPN